MAKTIIKIILGVGIALFIVTFAIAVPILFKPFYYWNIKWLDMPESSGFSEETIKTAYDDMIDYLVYGEQFKTGDLPHSEESISHFEDVKKLFSLNFWVLGISAVCIILIFTLVKTKKLSLNSNKHTTAFYSALGLIGFFAAIGIWGAIDFSSLFDAFHRLFFYGKANWVFYNDLEIISILPEELWRNFGILVLSIIIIFVTIIFVHDYFRRKRTLN